MEIGSGSSHRSMSLILCTAVFVVIIQCALGSDEAKHADATSATTLTDVNLRSNEALQPDVSPNSAAESGSDVRSEPDVGPSSELGPDYGSLADVGPGSDGAGVTSLTDKASPVTNPNKAPPTSSPQYPGYTLYNGTEICFRANLYGQILITYYTTGLSQTKILTRTLDLPDTAQVQGSCGKQTTSFSLIWADGNYTLTFNFVQKEETGSVSPAVKVSTWYSDQIKFTFNTKNNPDFPHIKIASVYTAQSGEDEVHFEAPANFSYQCTTEEDITLYVMGNGTRDQSVIESADLSVWDVKVQAFELLQTGIFSESASCKPDIDKKIPHQNVVPVAVAACLAGLIVVIVIAYFFIKNRPNTQYNAME